MRSFFDPAHRYRPPIRPYNHNTLPDRPGAPTPDYVGENKPDDWPQDQVRVPLPLSPDRPGAPDHDPI